MLSMPLKTTLLENFRRHLLSQTAVIKEGLFKLNSLAADAILFVVDNNDRLVGSLTDGDVRRGFLRGLNFDHGVLDFLQPKPRFINRGNYSVDTIIEYRKKNFRIVPVVDEERRIVNVINFRLQKSYLPLDSVIMAGGRGERLRPLTDTTPKALLQVGEKSIIEHNLDRLISYGVDSYWMSVRYMGEQLEKSFGSGASKNVSIQYVWEEDALGTIGAVAQIKNFTHDYIIVTNSDILTNLDYEDFFLTFLNTKADFSVVTIPYEVNIPYAVLETSNGHVMSFKEKPTYTYYSNGGIYLMKRAIADLIPRNRFYNATDLMENLIRNGMKVHSYPMHGYWLDIGRRDDLIKAQQDILHVKF